MAQTNSIEAIPITLEFKSPRREFAQYEGYSEPTTASEYFAKKFPTQTKLYGPAVLEAVTHEFDNRKQSKAVYMNEDWAVGVLGSNPRLGHHVVYYTIEGTFWFYDAILFQHYSGNCRNNWRRRLVLELVRKVLGIRRNCPRSRSNSINHVA